MQWIPELGLVTSSLDATIKTFDINRCAAAAVPGAQQQPGVRGALLWQNPA